LKKKKGKRAGIFIRKGKRPSREAEGGKESGSRSIKVRVSDLGEDRRGGGKGGELGALKRKEKGGIAARYDAD